VREPDRGGVLLLASTVGDDDDNPRSCVVLIRDRGRLDFAVSGGADASGHPVDGGVWAAERPGKIKSAVRNAMRCSPGIHGPLS
jgi:hypothetical protein